MVLFDRFDCVVDLVIVFGINPVYEVCDIAPGASEVRELIACKDAGGHPERHLRVACEVEIALVSRSGQSEEDHLTPNE